MKTINKLLLTGVFFLFGVTISNAQEVELKNDQVLLNGKPILKYEKINAWQFSFYSLDGDSEILMYRNFDNETPKYPDDDYYTLHFLTVKKKVESTDYSHIVSFMNAKKGMEKRIKWLLKEKVLDESGKLNTEKLEVFYDKYNENIQERTIRH